MLYYFVYKTQHYNCWKVYWNTSEWQCNIKSVVKQNHTIYSFHFQHNSFKHQSMVVSPAFQISACIAYLLETPISYTWHLFLKIYHILKDVSGLSYVRRRFFILIWLSVRMVHPFLVCESVKKVLSQVLHIDKIQYLNLCCWSGWITKQCPPASFVYFFNLFIVILWMRGSIIVF